jgi:signal-transduction protein with cAMP-binding, CBS, and nucleotidyltransferase domain
LERSVTREKQSATALTYWQEACAITGHEASKKMLISLLMTSNPVTISPRDTLQAAISLMERGKFRRLPVVEGEQLVGCGVRLSPFFAEVYLLLAQSLAEPFDPVFHRAYP